MGNWGNVCYIHCADKTKILSAIETIFSTENRKKVDRPLERNINHSSYDEPMQYGNSKDCNLWGVVLIEGKNDWTAIQTAPLELLCEKNALTNEFRLVELAKTLKTECIYFGIYDSSFSILAEALPTGEYAVSGFNDDGSGDMSSFHGFGIGEDNFIAHFQICKPEMLLTQINNHSLFHSIFMKLFDEVNIDEDGFENMESNEVIAEAFGKTLCGDDFEYWNNSLNIEYLIPHKEIKKFSCLEAYFRSKSN